MLMNVLEVVCTCIASGAASSRISELMLADESAQVTAKENHLVITAHPGSVILSNVSATSHAGDESAGPQDRLRGCCRQ